MKSKTVTRYNCDFCNKRGFSSPHMAKHEKHCTLNPARECRMCSLLSDTRHYDFEHKPLAELIAMLPDSSAYNAVKTLFLDREHERLTEALKLALPVFRIAAGGCPVCMMAALRQAKIPVPMAEGFDFSAEMKALWGGINQAKAAQESYY